ncbi:hypothetical protein PENTCL1PPCAC_19454, partial [Pristionchus entomophagus]
PRHRHWRPSYHMQILKELEAKPKEADATAVDKRYWASRVDEFMEMMKIKEDKLETDWKTMPTPDKLFAYGMTTVRTTDNHGLIECRTMEHSAKPLHWEQRKWRHTVIMKDVAKSDEDALVMRLVQWSQRGFINYYGFDGAFGKDPVHVKFAEIGKHCLQGRWEEAARLMGFDGPVDGVNWASCVLTKSKRVRSLYITAYQNLLWNKFASDRVSLYGATIFDYTDLDIYCRQLDSIYSNPFDIVVQIPDRFTASLEGCYEHDFYGDRLKEDGLTWECFEKASSNFDLGDAWHRVMFERPTNVQWETQSMVAGPDAKLTVIIQFDLPDMVDASSAMREITSISGGNREGETKVDMAKTMEPKMKTMRTKEEDEEFSRFGYHYRISSSEEEND